MSIVSLLKESSVRELYEKVPENLEIYRSGVFDYLLSNATLFLGATCELDSAIATSVICTPSDYNEVGCCLALYNSLSGITPSLARDQRLWTRLCHIEFLEYSRIRWEIPTDDDTAISHIRRHFFARGTRGIERDNSLSRLWWMAKICSKAENLGLEDALKAFLYQSDVRANIVERPTTSQNTAVLSAVINKLHESYVSDKALLEREPFRNLMKQLNLEGGTRLIEVLEVNEIDALVDKISKTV
jgi:Family of unknown function (DUF6339)